MKFYDRNLEIETLRRIEATSHDYAQMTVITGRRRIGKTTLIKHAYAGVDMIYFFVARKSEALLCKELSDTIRELLGEDLGEFTSMARLFAAVMQIAKRRNFTFVFDEFQNFKYVNESFVSDMQNIWDSNKDEAKINLIVCGSLYSMMTKIFDDRKEPLYGRATSRIRLREFPLATVREIMKDNNPDYTPDDLLAMYMITGGVAKYIEQLHMARAFTKDRILESVLSFGSYFIVEVKNCFQTNSERIMVIIFQLCRLSRAASMNVEKSSRTQILKPEDILTNLKRHMIWCIAIDLIWRARTTVTYDTASRIIS